MDSKIFDYDNRFWQFMCRVWDLMILNLLCIICSLPVITAGASVTALYYVTLKMAEGRESHIYRSFLKAFKQNLLQSTAIEAILAAAGVIIAVDVWYFVQGGGKMTAGTFPAGGTVQIVMLGVLIIFLLAVVMTALYVFAVQARFSNPVRCTIKNAFFMAIRHLPLTVGMIILDTAFFLLLAGRFSWLIFWAVSAPIYINSMFLCRIFRKYMPE